MKSTTTYQFGQPTVMPHNEIVFADGHKIIYPPCRETVRFQEVSLRDAYVNDTFGVSSPENDTVPLPPADAALTWTGVMDAFVEAPESHAKGRIRVPRVPVGGMVLIVLGLALMAFGWMLNEPVSWAIYGMIHK